jgi:hypothetical protein
MSTWRIAVFSSQSPREHGFDISRKPLGYKTFGLQSQSMFVGSVAGELSPRQGRWSRRRRARSGGVSHASEPLKSRLKSSPSAFQHRPCRGLRPGQSLRLHPNLSCAACPGRDGPCCAPLQRGCRSVLGAPHAPRARRGRRRGALGAHGRCRHKRPFILPIRHN